MFRLLSEEGTVLAESHDGREWAFFDDDLQRAFETLLIEGVAKGRRNYLPGDKKFAELFWEELLGDEIEIEEVMMPKAMLDKLSGDAKKVYEAAYEAAKGDGKDEAEAGAIAIGALKNAGYDKNDENDWVKMSMVDANMYFTKASQDQETGEMRWSATVSKFETDRQADMVTPEFYKSAIACFQAGNRPAPVVCISHVDHGLSTDGWVAGDTVKMFVDGERPKAKGTFRDTELGRAAFQAVKGDIASDVPHEERARISMGFFDEGSEPNVVKSDNGAERTGRKFNQGWIKHFAITRVPVVPETEIGVEKSQAGKATVFGDASSIVGEELARKLLSQAAKSEAPIAPEGLVTKGKLQIEEVWKQFVKVLEGLGIEVQVTDFVANATALGSSGTNPERAAPLKSEYHTEIDNLVDTFATEVKAAVKGEGDRRAKFATIQKALDLFGQGIQELVVKGVPPSTGDISEAIQAAVEAATVPLKQEMLSVKAELDRVKAMKGAAPAPASMDSKAVIANDVPPSESQRKGRVFKVGELARRSVGLPVQY